MTTLSALKTDIADDLGTSDYTSLIALEITKAIALYQNKRWWFGESKEYTFSTVADQADYAEGDDADIAKIIKLDAVHLVKASYTYELDWISHTEMDILNDGTADSGEPYNYSYFNSKITLYRVPDAVYTVRLLGQFIVAGPASDVEANNVWMTKAYDLIRAQVVKRIALSKMQDAELAQLQTPIIVEEERKFNKETMRRRSTGKLKPTRF